METSRVGIDLFKTLLKPDARSAHLLAFGTAFGSSIWMSFVGGIISYKSLPRQTFGTLQSKLFPAYFGLNALLSTVMVGTLAWDFQVIRDHPFDILDATVYQAFTLVTCAASHLVNALIVGPASTKIMFERHRQERTEGKEYQDVGVSDKMKTLNKEFASLHGISTTLNLVSIGGLAFHALVRRSPLFLFLILLVCALSAAAASTLWKCRKTVNAHDDGILLTRRGGTS